MVFGFIKKDDGSPGRFMADIDDDLYGGHLDGDTLVISRSLGGGRYTLREMDEGDPPSPGEFHLLHQRFEVRRKSVGPTRITVEPVPYELASRILSWKGLGGMVSVYTPEREDALRLVEDACGSAREHLYFAPLNTRLRMFSPRGKGNDEPAPVCCFGGPIDEKEGDDMADFVMGFHVVSKEPPLLQLSVDLGGMEFMVRDLDDSGFSSVPEGEFRILISLRRNGICNGDAISTEAIGRELAEDILMNRSRGYLSVYTPRREDAEGLAMDVFGEAHHSDTSRHVLSTDVRIVSAKRTPAAPVVAYGDMIARVGKK